MNHAILQASKYFYTGLFLLGLYRLFSMPKSDDFVSIDLDSEDDSTESLKSGDDFPSMLVKLFSRMNIKVAIFLFIFGLFIFSDVFVRTILSNFNNAVNQLEAPTTHGTILQLTFLVIGYILIDLLAQGKYI